MRGERWEVGSRSQTRTREVRSRIRGDRGRGRRGAPGFSPFSQRENGGGGMRESGRDLKSTCVGMVPPPRELKSTPMPLRGIGVEGVKERGQLYDDLN